LKYHVIISGWNCEQFVKGCLDSVRNQTYKDFKVTVIDDGSTDSTCSEILRHAPLEWDVIANAENMGGFYNFDMHTRTSQCEIIIPMALDDIMLPDAIERIDKEYQKGVWMTYGTWINKQGVVFTNLHYSDEIHKARDYRKDTFRCTGLRTYYKWLYELTQTYPMDEIERTRYYDLEYAWQMLEMCGKNRIGVITEPVYEYNNTNPLGTAQRFGIERVKYKEIANRPKKDLLIRK
jgi:glycosyltransferase involved in cell wall biosynthesis